MNKTDLVNAIAYRRRERGVGGGGPRIKLTETEKMVNAFIETISETLTRKEKVTIVGFGTFSVAHRKAKTGVNPKTGAKITIKGKDVPVFKPGKALKDMVK